MFLSIAKNHPRGLGDTSRYVQPFPGTIQNFLEWYHEHRLFMTFMDLTEQNRLPKVALIYVI